MNIISAYRFIYIVVINSLREFRAIVILILVIDGFLFFIWACWLLISIFRLMFV